MEIAIFRINYKSDFILTLNSDAGWMTPFCIKFWTGAPSQAYFVGFDGTTYTHCAPVDGEPTKLRVQFDDHHLPIGDLKFQIGYHFTVADFPTSVEDEVLNQASVIIEVDGAPAQVMLDFNGETAPEIEFSLPAYANEAQRIANEQQRIENEQARISAENERISNEDARIAEEQVRVSQEAARVSKFAQLKGESQEATAYANAAAALANEKASLAQQKATYAQTQGDYAKDQGDIAQTDHQRAESDHTTATADHAQAAADHTRAESDHTTATADHAQAAADHTRAESDHTRAENDHEAVEVYVDSLGAFDISAYHATGGVLAKYADLTAALGTDGANIPDAIRKGGMSVKFVLSSDNKYVQFRYMGTSTAAADFTNTANWQNVDVEKDIAEYLLAEEESIISNKKINSDGSLSDDSDYTLKKFHCESGQKFKVSYLSTYGSTDTRLYAVYSSDTVFDVNTAIEIGNVMVGKTEPDYITIPECAVCVIIASRVTTHNNSISLRHSAISLIDGIKPYIEDVAYLDENVYDKEKSIVPSSTIPGKKLDWDGKMVDLESSQINIYSCKKGDKFHVTSPHKGSTGAYLYVFYNSDTTFNKTTAIEVGNEINAAIDKIITAPDGAVCLAFQKRFYYDSNFTIEGNINNVADLEERVSNLEQDAEALMYVSYSNSTIKVNRKYSSTKDIQVELAPFGVNNLVQLKRWGFINNTNKSVSPNSPSGYVDSGTDWICPYSMWSMDGTTYGQGGFTGGCHGSNGDATGEPTAETSQVKVYVNNMEVTDGHASFCSDVRVEVTNRIMAGNTLSNTEQSIEGYYCLEEKVTYYFKDNKIYVSVLGKALHNISISIYYGTGVSQFANEVTYFGKNIQKNDFTSGSRFTEKCNGFACSNSSGEYIIAHLNDVGLAQREEPFYAHSYTYGKAYFALISQNDNNPLVLAPNEQFYWNGWLQFSDTLNTVFI